MGRLLWQALPAEAIHCAEADLSDWPTRVPRSATVSNPKPLGMPQQEAGRIAARFLLCPAGMENPQGSIARAP